MAGRLLLLGATGFAGRHFRRAAERAGFEIVGATRRPGEAEIACDLLAPTSIERAVRETRPDAVVNLAGAASVARSFREPLEAFEINALGVLGLLEAIARHAPETHVLCVSSGEVYGEPPERELPVTEERPLWPVSAYGASKAAMELICEQYEQARHLRITVARSFNHTGPGQSDRFAASSFARQIAEAERDGRAEAILEVGNVDAVRDFTDVRDVVRAYLSLVERGATGVFNVCSGRPTRLGGIIELLKGASSLPVRVRVSEGRLRSGEPAALYGSGTKLERATGWRPEIPLSRTVADLLQSWSEELQASR